MSASRTSWFTRPLTEEGSRRAFVAFCVFVASLVVLVAVVVIRTEMAHGRAERACADKGGVLIRDGVCIDRAVVL